MLTVLILGLVLLAVAFVIIVAAARKTAEQSRRAGADPSQGELAYEWQGGVSRATSFVMLGGWALLIIGGVVTIVALV